MEKNGIKLRWFAYTVSEYGYMLGVNEYTNGKLSGLLLQDAKKEIAASIKNFFIVINNNEIN